MKILAFSLGAVMLAGAISAQDQTFETGAFRAIEAKKGIALTVSIADDYAVTAQAIDGDISFFRVNEFLPWLVLDRETRWFIFGRWRQDQFAATIQTPVLNGIKAVDGAQVAFSGNAKQRLWAEATEDGVLTLMDVRVDDLTLFARDEGQITAAGQCDTLTIRSDDGAIDASGLDCGSIVVNGDAELITLPDRAVPVDEHPKASG